MPDSGSPIQSLYPFLHGGEKDATRERANLLTSIERKAAHSVEVKQQFFADHAEGLIDAAAALARVFRNKGRVLTMGNGGSSCDAAHFAVEFQHPVTTGRPALPTINLASDMAMISAVANDVGAEHIFLRQLEAHGRREDALIGFSTSGNSENLINAYRRARDLGITTLGLAGGDGGAMATSGLVEHCLVVASDSIHRVQETHVAAYHILWDLVHTLLADQRGKLGDELGGNAP